MLKKRIHVADNKMTDESMFQSVNIKGDDEEDELFKSAIDTEKSLDGNDLLITHNGGDLTRRTEEPNLLDVDIQSSAEPTNDIKTNGAAHHQHLLLQGSSSAEPPKLDVDEVEKKEEKKRVSTPPSVFNSEFKELPTIQLSQTKNILSPISPLEESVNPSDDEDNHNRTSTSPEKSKGETNNNSSTFLSITVTEPNKIGEGYGSYVAYRVETRTNMKDFRRPEAIVPRRFSDFLALHEKLVEKYLKNGRIIPPAPGKAIMSTTKLKMSSQPDQEQDFVEKRRKALERYLTRTASHPVLRDDPDFREFLEADGELPRATNTSALSGAGVLRFMNRFGETVQKFSFKMDETDQWFIDKTLLLDNIESQLSNLHFSIDNLVANRRELSLLCGHFAKSIAVLSNIEEHVSLARVLAKLSELYEKIEHLYMEESMCDFHVFCELFKDYVALVGSVKEAFHARVKIYQTWQSWQVTLNKKRETKVKLELAGRSDKSIQAANEVTEWEQKVERCQEEFNAISAMIKTEFDQFEINRVQEFKCVITKYIEKLMSYQQETIEYWQAFIPEVNTIQLKSNANSTSTTN